MRFVQFLFFRHALVLHNKEILPPRIEVYRTDIDYHDNNEFFWESIGISAYNSIQIQFLPLLCYKYQSDSEYQ